MEERVKKLEHDNEVLKKTISVMLSNEERLKHWICRLQQMILDSTETTTAMMVEMYNNQSVDYRPSRN